MMAADWKDGQNLGARGGEWAGFCARCTALRAEEELSCEDCGAARPSAGWPGVEEALDPFLGRVLMERYLIEKIEGRGASSTVYRARSLAVPKRFAIKMVKLGFSDNAKTRHARERLEREVRAVGMLRSPHIVRIYDMMEVEGGWMALVMEHIDGDTLSARVHREGPLEVGAACRLLRQVANGLCEAHQSGMVHRDIKPENIMLEELPDGSDFAFLLDFGVVRLQNEAAMTQGFVGTPLYASPEQAVGQLGVVNDPGLAEISDGEIDVRSDIYSLGATFFFMLTGRAPFEYQRSLDVLRAHLSEPAPALSEALAGANFSDEIEQIVADMLAKDPANRPANLFKVIDALEALEAGRGGAASSSVVSSRVSPGRSKARQEGEESAPRPISRERQESATLVGSSLVEEADQRHSDAQVGGVRQGQWERVSTEPGGIHLPQTLPPGMNLSELERFTERTLCGQPFAREVRLVSALGEQQAALVDSHNEIWSLEDSELQPICTPPASRVCAVTASEGQVFVGLYDGTINRVDPARRALDRLFPTQEILAEGRVARSAGITALVSGPGGEYLVAATKDATLWIGERREEGRGEEYRWSARALDAQQAMALGHDSDLLAAASADQRVRVVSVEQPESELVSFQVEAPVIDMAFSRNDDLLAVLVKGPRSRSGTERATVLVYQVLAGQKLYQFNIDAPAPRNIFFSTRNAIFGVCAAHGRIGYWNLMADRASAPAHPR